MKHVILAATLMLFYAVLSGQFDSAFLMKVGVVVCIAITWLSAHMKTVDEEGFPVEYWARTISYGPWLTWQIVLSNIDVLKRVWHPNMPISPCMVKVPHQLKTAFGISTYANSITLTPGTVTVYTGNDEFLVHALTRQAADDLLAGEMHRRILAIENPGEDAPATSDTDSDKKGTGQ